MITTTHQFGKNGVTLTWDSKEGRSSRAPYAFEVYDLKTDGGEYYREGNLSFDGSTLIGFDGVSVLPVALAFALHHSGFGFAPYMLPDVLFSSHSFAN